MSRRALLVGAGLAVLLAWLVGYPLAVTFAAALAGPSPGGVLGFLGPLGEVLARPDELAALGRSLWISLASVALSAALGVPLAFLFTRHEFPGRRALAALVALPVALPPLVGVIAFLYLYGESGLAARAVQGLLGLAGAPWRLTGPGAILLVHAYSMYVYFYLFTRAALLREDPSLAEAAAVLGAGRFRTLVRITLPALGPALAGAAVLVFMTSLGSFSAPYLFGGSFRVMTTQILSSKQNGDLEHAEGETALLVAAALGGLWVARRLDRRRDRPVGQHGTPPAPRRSPRRAVRVAAAVGGWALALLLLAPHATLLLLSFVPPGSWTTEAFPPVFAIGNYAALVSSAERLRPVVNSLWMAAVATAGALALGLAVAQVAVMRRGRLGSVLEWLMALPWAVPGTAFAFALATTFSVNSPLTLRFLLIGTPWILPLAYLVRALPVTGGAALTGLRRLDPSLAEAASSLGASPARIFRRVTLPAIAPALAAGASLALLAALGDFVLSIVLYGYETRPISIEILSALRLQETGVAAAYGVLLAAASAVAFLLFGQEQGSGG